MEGEVVEWLRRWTSSPVEEERWFGINFLEGGGGWFRGADGVRGLRGREVVVRMEEGMIVGGGDVEVERRRVADVSSIMWEVRWWG